MERTLFARKVYVAACVWTDPVAEEEIIVVCVHVDFR